jgi:hypothetical protein
VIDGRRQLIREGIPFSRPTDYFAEMVKTDEQMGLIKRKLYEEAASKKAAAEARRQRDLKKFGKQVQVAKLQQRQKEKRETLEKINSLKRSTYLMSILSPLFLPPAAGFLCFPNSSIFQLFLPLLFLGINLLVDDKYLRQCANQTSPHTRTQGRSICYYRRR